MGNLFDNSLTEIWYSSKWNKFRTELFDYCQACPINLYMGLNLRPTPPTIPKPQTTARA